MCVFIAVRLARQSLSSKSEKSDTLKNEKGAQKTRTNIVGQNVLAESFIHPKSMLPGMFWKKYFGPQCFQRLYYCEIANLSNT